MQVTDKFNHAVTAILEAGQRIHQRGWSPATSSNYSLRLDESSCAMTVSGRDKGNLVPLDVMRVDLQGTPLPGETGVPSAETLLHTSLYRRDAAIGAVLHTHSLNALLAAQCVEAQDVAAQEPWNILEIGNLELLKAFPGINSHQDTLRIPVFSNSQDIPALARLVEECLDVAGPVFAYILRGHGVYTWGRDMAAAMRHLEALDQLFEYTWRVRGRMQDSEPGSNGDRI